jgi:hypothetical protein
MRDFTNTSRSPRGLMTLGGSVAIVQPGQTRALDVSDAEADSWALAVGASAPAAATQESARAAEGGEGASTAADLIAAADGMNFMAFKSAAAKVLADGVPSTKAEIIAALQAKVDAEAGA